MNPHLSRSLALVSALWLGAGLASAQLARPISSYDLRARLDVKTHTIHGSETLTWVNDSPDTVPALRFHLYMNAFKNQKSTFMRESGGQLRGDRFDNKEWGWIDVQSMRLEGGSDITAGLRYIHPDDDNADDQTVAEVTLPEPVKPGATLRLHIVFETRLPTVFAPPAITATSTLPANGSPSSACGRPPASATRARAPGTATSSTPTASFSPTSATTRPRSRCLPATRSAPPANWLIRSPTPRPGPRRGVTGRMA
jgi:hypothetical protein